MGSRSVLFCVTRECATRRQKHPGTDGLGSAVATMQGRWMGSRNNHSCVRTGGLRGEVRAESQVEEPVPTMGSRKEN